MLIENLPYSLQRLQLRTLRQDDLNAFHDYRNDAEVARYQGWAPMTTLEAADFLKTQSGQNSIVPGAWVQLGLAELEGDLLIGDIGIWLSPDSTKAEFGISLALAAQGKGYGTEGVRGLLALLFSTTPVTEVIASTDSRNAACLAVLTRAGMQPVETRQAEYKGELCTEHVFVLRRGKHTADTMLSVGGVLTNQR